MESTFYIRRMSTSATHAPGPLSAGDQPTTLDRRTVVVLPLVLIVFRLGLLASAASGCVAYGHVSGVGTRAALVWMNLAIVAVDLACLGMTSLVLRQEERLTLRSLLATRSRGRDVLLGLGLFVVLTVAFVAAQFGANLAVYRGAPTVGAAPHVPLALGIVSLVVMPATIALAEEVVYRAYALPRLARSLGPVGAALVSSLLFGLQHVLFAPGDPREMVARALTTFLAGLVLSALWFRFRRVWPLVVAHWLLDALFLGAPMLALALGTVR